MILNLFLGVCVWGLVSGQWAHIQPVGKLPLSKLSSVVSTDSIVVGCLENSSGAGVGGIMFASPGDLESWKLAYSHEGYMLSCYIASTGNGFIAVWTGAAQKTFGAASRDGQAWDDIEVGSPVRQLVGLPAAGSVAALSSNTTNPNGVWVSKDGIDWIQRAAPAACQSTTWFKITAVGTSLYWWCMHTPAVRGKVFVSDDAASSWSLFVDLQVAIPDGCRSITCDVTLVTRSSAGFVVALGGNFAFSADGKTWKYIPSPRGPNEGSAFPVAQLACHHSTATCLVLLTVSSSRTGPYGFVSRKGDMSDLESVRDDWFIPYPSNFQTGILFATPRAFLVRGYSTGSMAYLPYTRALAPPEPIPWTLIGAQISGDFLSMPDPPVSTEKVPLTIATTRGVWKTDDGYTWTKIIDKPTRDWRYVSEIDRYVHVTWIDRGSSDRSRITWSFSLHHSRTMEHIQTVPGLSFFYNIVRYRGLVFADNKWVGLFFVCRDTCQSSGSSPISWGHFGIIPAGSDGSVHEGALWRTGSANRNPAQGVSQPATGLIRFNDSYLFSGGDTTNGGGMTSIAISFNAENYAWAPSAPRLHIDLQSLERVQRRVDGVYQGAMFTSTGYILRNSTGAFERFEHWRSGMRVSALQEPIVGGDGVKNHYIGVWTTRLSEDAAVNRTRFDEVNTQDSAFAVPGAVTAIVSPDLVSWAATDWADMGGALRFVRTKAHTVGITWASDLLQIWVRR